MSLRHEHKGTGGGGLTDIDIISSRNTIEVEREGDVFDVNIAGETREFYVKNFTEFMDAVKTCAEAYLSNDPVQNVIKLLDHIDMTVPTEEDEAKYVVNGNALIDRANKKYNFGVYLYRTKIVSHGQQRALQLLYPVTGQYFDTWQISVVRFICENIGLGGEIAVWSDHFHPGSVANLPVRFQRYLLSSNGNFYYWLKDCTITCCGAPQNEVNSFNPFIQMGNASNSSAGLWVTNLTLDNCRFTAGDHAVNGGHANLNAPIVINSEYRQNRAKEINFKQLSKQVNDSAEETNVPNIQLRSDVPNDVRSNWESYKWSTFSDGSVLFSCDVSEDCIIFTPKLAVNDLYLQGTPLTPPGNPPTENFVSLVSLLQNQGRQVIDSQYLEYFIGQITGNDDFVRVDGNIVLSRFFEYSNNFIFFDEHSHIDVEKTLYLMPIRGYVQLCGLLYGTDYGVSATCQTIYAECGGVGNTILKNSVKGASAQGLKSADIEVIEYNGENYLALVKNWSGGDLFLKGYSSLTQEEIDEDLILLYYDGTRQKWYSDSDLTQEVSFTVLETSGRFPASLDFGGNTTQVVAGDGTLLNWSDKLGYWIGTTANLPAVGSRESNKLYITTDY